MPIRDMLLTGFDQEMANTRKMLECVPEDRFFYQPNPQSWKLSRLAGLVAELPNWIAQILRAEILELGAGQNPSFEPSTRKELLDWFDKYICEARTAIANATDEQLNRPWSVKWDGETVITMSRLSVLHSLVLSHINHHRAQLRAYLRLNDISVPGMDDPWISALPPWMKKNVA